MAITPDLHSGVTGSTPVFSKAWVAQRQEALVLGTIQCEFESHPKHILEVWPSGLRQKFTKLPRYPFLRGFESHCFRFKFYGQMAELV